MTQQNITHTVDPSRLVRLESSYKGQSEMTDYYRYLSPCGTWCVVYDARAKEGRKFSIGDTCFESSYNLVYFGRIVKFTEKNVIVEKIFGNGNSKNESKVHMKWHQFAVRNCDFDFERCAKRNSEWMD